MNIVLDQCTYNNKLMKGSLTTQSNICRGTSALFSFQIHSVIWRFKNKKWWKEWGVGDVNLHEQRIFGREAYLVKLLLLNQNVLSWNHTRHSAWYLENQPCYTILSNQWLHQGRETVHNFRLDNGPKSNKITAK